MTSARCHISKIAHLEPAEFFRLYGQHITPLCEIEIGRVDDRWYVCASASWASGGFGGHLAWTPEQPDRGAHDTREQAIAAGIAEARRRMGGAPERETVKHHAWLDQLEEREVRQADLFADRSA